MYLINNYDSGDTFGDVVASAISKDEIYFLRQIPALTYGQLDEQPQFNAIDPECRDRILRYSKPASIGIAQDGTDHRS